MVAIMIAVVLKMGSEVMFEWRVILIGILSVFLTFSIKKFGSG
jgi:hypothetical protein